MDVRKLIDYTNEQIELREEQRFNQAGSIGSKKARNPLIILYLGKSAADNMFNDIHRQISRIWTPYRDVIPSMIVEQEEDGTPIFLDLDGKKLTRETLANDLNELYGMLSHFAGYNYLDVFIVMDTTSLNDDQAVRGQLSLMKRIRAAIPTSNQRTIAAVLLDESLGREENAHSVKQILGKEFFVGGGESRLAEYVDCLYLVANRNSQGGMMIGTEDWGRIVGDLIVLTSRTDGQTNTALQNPGMKTVCFAMEKKPVDSISTTVATNVLNELGQELSELTNTTVDMDDLIKKLNLTGGVIFPPIQQMIRMVISSFPNEELFQRFPRTDSEDHGYLSDLAVRDFNRVTLGAWDAFVNRVVDTIRLVMQTDTVRANQWKTLYSNFLKEKFSIYELMGISQHQVTIRNMIQESVIVSDSERMLDSLEKCIAKRLLQDEWILNLLVNGITDLGESGSAAIGMWRQTIASMREVIVGDALDMNVKNYYGNITKSYFISKKMEILRDLDEVDEEHEIDEFVCKLCAEVVASKPVFGATFEEEMTERIDNQADLEHAQNEVQQKLTGANVKTWLITTGAALDSARPENTLVFVKEGSSLGNYLKNNLDPGVSYYSSLSGDAIEVIQILNIQHTHLM